MKVVCPATQKCDNEKTGFNIDHCILHDHTNLCRTTCYFSKNWDSLCEKPTKEIIAYLVLQKIK